LLYYFYLTSYKILLGYYENIEIEDSFPLHTILKNKLSLWIHDMIAPFYQYLRVHFKIKPVWVNAVVDPTSVRLSSKVFSSSFGNKNEESSGTILLAENHIKEFSFETSKLKIWAQSSNALS
jgi:hypothetical protein